MICYSFWNTKNVVRPILGAIAKRFDKIKYVNVLDANLSQFATSVMDPCLIPCCRSDITRAVCVLYVNSGHGQTIEIKIETGHYARCFEDMA